MARVDSGHETVTSEEEDSITPKYSPVSMTFYDDSCSEQDGDEKVVIKEAFLEQEACLQCQLSSRRYPITCENDLYRLPACKHENSSQGNRSSSAVTYREHNSNRRLGTASSISRDTCPDPTKRHPPRLTGTLNPVSSQLMYSGSDLTIHFVSNDFQHP